MVKNLNASKMQSSRFCVLFIGSHMFSFRPRNFLFLISRTIQPERPEVLPLVGSLSSAAGAFARR